MAAGRLFIQIDNVRPPLHSQYLESGLTADRITVRIPYHSGMEFDPRRHFFFISSNIREIVEKDPLAMIDLRRRSSLVRIHKRYNFRFNQYKEGHIVAHIKAHQSFYLSCVFSVVREWIRLGKPRTDETRHSFRDWAQIMDWIVQNLFFAAPLFEDHDAMGNLLPPKPYSDPFENSLFTTGG
jgi:hypothetical protein